MLDAGNRTHALKHVAIEIARSRFVVGAKAGIQRKHELTLERKPRTRFDPLPRALRTKRPPTASSASEMVSWIPTRDGSTSEAPHGRPGLVLQVRCQGGARQPPRWTEREAQRAEDGETSGDEHHVSGRIDRELDAVDRQ